MSAIDQLVRAALRGQVTTVTDALHDHDRACGCRGQGREMCGRGRALLEDLWAAHRAASAPAPRQMTLEEL